MFGQQITNGYKLPVTPEKLYVMLGIFNISED